MAPTAHDDMEVYSKGLIFTSEEKKYLAGKETDTKTMYKRRFTVSKKTENLKHEFIELLNLDDKKAEEIMNIFIQEYNRHEIVNCGDRRAGVFDYPKAGVWGDTVDSICHEGSRVALVNPSIADRLISRFCDRLEMADHKMADLKAENDELKARVAELSKLNYRSAELYPEDLANEQF